MLPLLSDVTHIAVVNFTMDFSNSLDRVVGVLLSFFPFLVRREGTIGAAQVIPIFKILIKNQAFNLEA